MKGSNMKRTLRRWLATALALSILFSAAAAVSAAAVETGGASGETASYTKNYAAESIDGETLKVSVETQDAEVGAELENSTLTITKQVYGDDYDAVSGLLADMYSNTSDVKLYAFMISDGEGQEISLPDEDTTVTVTYTWQVGNGETEVPACEMKLLSFDGQSLSAREIDSSEDAGSDPPYFYSQTYTYRADSLSPLVSVNVGAPSAKETAAPLRVDTIEDQTYTKNYPFVSFGNNELLTVSVETTDSEAGPKLENSRINIQLRSSGDDRDSAKSLLDAKYIGVTSFTMYSFVIKDENGAEISLPEDGTTVTVVYKSNISDWGSGIAAYEMKLFSYDGAALSEQPIDSEADNGSFAPYLYAYTYTYTTNTLNSLVAVNVGGLEEAGPGELPVCDWEPGDYTVTANLYVRGDDNVVIPGLTVYVSNPDFPPTSPASEKVKLTVGTDGSLTLTFDNLNPVFTLQQINDGTDVHILERIWQHPEDYPEMNWGKVIDKRINGLVLSLDNMNGDYAFTDCMEYPIVLENAPNGGYKTMPIRLAVDFDSAEKGFAGSEDATVKTFIDADTGAQITVRTTEESIAPALEGAELRFEQLDNTAYRPVVNNLYNLYAGDNPEYSVYRYSLWAADGSEIQLMGNSRVEYALKSGWSDPAVFQVSGGESKEIKFIGIGGMANFSLKTLGTFLMIDNSAAVRWLICSYTSEETGLSFTYYNSRALLLAGQTGKEGQIKSTGMGTEYHFGFYNQNNGPSGFYDVGNTRVSVTLPYENESQKKIYMIVEEASGALFAKELDLSGAARGDGTITFDLLDPNSYPSRGIADYIMVALARGADKEGTIPANDLAGVGLNGYLLVTDKSIASMPILPKQANGNSVTISYTGVEQQGVQSWANCQVAGAVTARHAGTYTFTATPDDGYVWADGSSDSRILSWTINKSGLTCDYAGEVIEAGAEPKLEVTYIGFKNGEDPDTADDFVPPIIPRPESLQPGTTYKGIYPSGGSAKNYDLRYTGGTLTVLPEGAGMVEKPTARTGLVSDGKGTELVGIEGDGNGVAYDLTGTVKASEPGEYTATATLREGYYWSDGSRNVLQIKWSIAAGSGTPVNPGTPVTRTVTANLYIPGELNPLVPGLQAYMTNPDNPLGIGGHTGLPTVPATNNAKLTTDTNGTMTLELDIVNPVFTLQQIGGGSTATVVATKTVNGTFGARSSRISHLTIELERTTDGDEEEYVFENCVEHPTLISTDWHVPLTLHVNFTGGNSGLPSDEDPDVDVGGIIGNTKGDTVTKVDPVTGAVTETTTYSNGTVSITVTQTDGSFVNTMETKNGSTSETTVDTAGKSQTTVALVKDDVKDVESGKPVTLPMPDVTATKDVDTAPSIKLTSLGDSSARSLLVTVPVEKPAYGIVIMKVNADGSTDVLRFTRYNDGKLTFQAEKDVTYKIVDNGKPFNDVAADNWYANAVQYVSARGMMNGIASTTFSPDATTSRGMFVTILHRMEDTPSILNKGKAFIDVTDNQYYSEAVAWAIGNKIVSGYNNGSFGPNDSITREQLAVMLWRYSGSPESAGTLDDFSDKDQVGSYATEAMAWAVEKGIMSGEGNGVLDPLGQATRAQAAQMLMNYIEKFAD